MAGVKAGDLCVLKTKYSNGEDARTNYPYYRSEVRRMQKEPQEVLCVNQRMKTAYFDVQTFLGRKLGNKKDHGKRWFLLSDPYNGGTWTKARMRSFVMSALRRAQWPVKFRAIKKAYVKDGINPATGRKCV
jgi:hypothetical protein